jgi:hypothetical protein
MRGQLRFRGPSVATGFFTPCGIQAVTAEELPVPDMCCVNRRRAHLDKVPRSRASPGRPRLTSPSSSVSSGSAIKFSDVCRCVARGVQSGEASDGSFVKEQAGMSTLHLQRRSISFGLSIMRQPNYAFERTANQQRYRLIVGRAAAQRKR